MIVKKLFILLCSLLIISCTQDNSAQDNRIVHDTTGSAIKLSELKGKWIILNDWADWCDSCAEEVPRLNYFYQHNTDKNIVLFGMNYDQLKGDDLQRAIKKMRIRYPVLVEDPYQRWVLEDTTILPTIYIINPMGKLAKKIVGSVTAEELETIIFQLQKNSNETKP